MNMHIRTAAVAAIASLGLAAAANAEALYFVNGQGLIGSFATGADLVGTTLTPSVFVGSSTPEATVPDYSTYQDFTMNELGAIIGVDANGSIEQWASLDIWLADGPSTILASNVYAADGQPGSLHGFSYDGNTGGYFATREDAGEADGDGLIFGSLADFLLGTSAATVVPATYGGNILNLYYPGEDIPGNRPNAANGNTAGANYLQITGQGQLEGWLSLNEADTGYLVDPGFRSFQVSGFGASVGSGFAVIDANVVPEPATAGALVMGLLGFAARRRR